MSVLYMLRKPRLCTIPSFYVFIVFVPAGESNPGRDLPGLNAFDDYPLHPFAPPFVVLDGARPDPARQCRVRLAVQCPADCHLAAMEFLLQLPVYSVFYINACSHRFCFLCFSSLPLHPCFGFNIECNISTQNENNKIFQVKIFSI